MVYAILHSEALVLQVYDSMNESVILSSANLITMIHVINRRYKLSNFNYLAMCANIVYTPLNRQANCIFVKRELVVFPVTQGKNLNYQHTRIVQIHIYIKLTKDRLSADSQMRRVWEADIARVFF